VGERKLTRDFFEGLDTISDFYFWKNGRERGRKLRLEWEAIKKKYLILYLHRKSTKLPQQPLSTTPLSLAIWSASAGVENSLPSPLLIPH
jgi:hypothetical protein